MAATPQYATFSFVGLRSRKSFTVDAYVSDVAAAAVRWDSGNGSSSTSDTFWTPPEPVALTDIAIVTGTADTTKISVTRDGRATGNILRYANHVNTLAQRPRLSIGFRAGEKIGAIQLA